MPFRALIWRKPRQKGRARTGPALIFLWTSFKQLTHQTGIYETVEGELVGDRFTKEAIINNEEPIRIRNRITLEGYEPCDGKLSRGFLVGLGASDGSGYGVFAHFCDYIIDLHVEGVLGSG